MSEIEARLRELKLEIPPYVPVADNLPLVHCVQAGNILYLSGHGPDMAGRENIRGQLGRNLELQDGCEAARRTALNLLATIKHHTGTLDTVQRIIKVFGMVNSAPDFTMQPTVINSASEIFVHLWGRERGKHARSAVGMAQLPNGMPVEIEMIVELADEQ